jgi:hypothetical protein
MMQETPLATLIVQHCISVNTTELHTKHKKIIREDSMLLNKLKYLSTTALSGYGDSKNLPDR